MIDFRYGDVGIFCGEHGTLLERISPGVILHQNLTKYPNLLIIMFRLTVTMRSYMQNLNADPALRPGNDEVVADINLSEKLHVEKVTGFYRQQASEAMDPIQKDALNDLAKLFEQMSRVADANIEDYKPEELVQMAHETLSGSLIDPIPEEEGGALTNAHVIRRRKVNLNVDEPEAPQHVISRRKVDLSISEPQQHVISRRKVNLSDE